MRRYLILILAIFVLASGLLAGCAEKRSTAELRAYLTDELSRLERYDKIDNAVLKAISAIRSEAEKLVTPQDESSSSKTKMEAIEPPKPPVPVGLSALSVEEIVRALTTPAKTEPTIPSGLKEALTSGVNTLDWAIEQIDSLILDYKRLSPPPEARTYHGLQVEILLKEQAIYRDFRSYFSSLLSYGKSDKEALDRITKQQAEATRLSRLARYESEDLLQNLRK